MRKITSYIIGLFAFVAAFTCILNTPVYAADDEILNYEITIDVNEDATLNMHYHIDWRVLESDKAGALTWVQIGVPNKHYVSYEALSDNIARMDISGSGSDTLAKIYFKDSYYKDDVISFDFAVLQDYMYQVDKLEEGYTVYSFTPGWFDEIDVDSLTIKWNNAKADSWTPDADMDGDYLTWNSSLAAGDKFTITVTYPNDAYGFDLTKVIKEPNKFVEAIEIILGIVLILLIIASPFLAIFFVCYLIYALGSGFKSALEKTITRTKVEYFDSCPGCGAPRGEGKEVCTYCGKNLIKSEEIIEENNLEDEDKGILDFAKEGLFQYSDDPNTYVRVHVSRGSFMMPSVGDTVKDVLSSTSRGGGSSHGSCAHSSCACACACACAGGGRAGCTTKDFYNTKLKLKHFSRAAQHKSK